MKLLPGVLGQRPITASGVAAGLVVAGIAWGLGSQWLPATMMGWCALVLTHGGLVMWQFWPAGPEDMRDHAETLNQGRWLVLSLSLLTAIAAVGAVALDISSNQKGSTPLSLATVLLSWFFVHLLFAQDYAREFWLTGGGIKFHGGEANPPFSEFLYFSYGIGATCGVTDVDTQSVSIRRVAMLHALIAFGFNTVILAGTINIVAGLAGGSK